MRFLWTSFRIGIKLWHLVQGLVSPLGTTYDLTIGDVADTKTLHAKPLPPNAASIDEVNRVKKRLETLGFGFHEATKAAGISKSVSFRLLRGLASLASLRKLEDWLVREETRSPVPTVKATQSKQNEWASLGAAIADADPEGFETMLEGLRDLVKAERDRSIALLKIVHSSSKR